MKHVVIFLLFVFGTAQLRSQDTSKVTVISAETNNGVVIISVAEGSGRMELQCNANMPACKKLAPGKYTMVRLPKGHGMYECDSNVDVYAGDPQSEQRLGQYCAPKS